MLEKKLLRMVLDEVGGVENAKKKRNDDLTHRFYKKKCKKSCFHEKTLVKIHPMKINKYLCALAIAGASTVPLSAATLSFNLAENSGNVTLTVSGAISDLTPWRFDTSISSTGNFAFIAGDPVFFKVLDPSGQFNEYVANTTPTIIGSGSPIYNLSGNTTTSVGFAVFNDGTAFLDLPRSYSLGSNLSASATFEGESIQSLGFNGGNYSWTFGADTIEVNVVPEPSALSLLAVGLGGLALVRRRRS